MSFIPIFFICIVLFVVLLAKSVKILREDQRGVIFRFGGILRIAGPGIIFILPFVDKFQKIDLNEFLPEWRTLPGEVLEEKMKSMAVNGPMRL